MRSNILISCENREEFKELLILTKELKKVVKSKFIFFDMGTLFTNTPLSKAISKEELSIFDKIIPIKNNNNKNFKKLPFIQKLKLVKAISDQLISTIKSNNINTLITGVPLVFFRVTKLRNSNIKYISYFRSIIIPTQKSHSTSDKINRFFQKTQLHKVANLEFLNDWYCDYLLTIGEKNKKFFIKYKNLPKRRVVVSGPLLLEQIKKNRKEESTLKEINQVYFATGAFKWHRNLETAKKQIEFFRNLLKNLYELEISPKIEIILRVHPRDDIKDYLHLQQDYKFEIDTTPIENFLQKASNDKILISFISTLNFEWNYIGGRSIFVTSKHIIKQYSEFYKWFEIKPLFLNEFLTLLKKGKEENLQIDHSILKKVYHQDENSNLTFTVNFIKKFVY